MSKPLFPDDILFLQRFLKSCGFYAGPLDGHFNSDVSHAEDALAAQYEAIKREMGDFDARSEAGISTLEPNAQRTARQFLKTANALPLTYKIISGTRTFAEQDELFAQGRTKPGKIVTKAKGGESNHNFGIAWDVGIFNGRDYLTGETQEEEQAYINLGKHILAHLDGLEWGGDWHDFVDRPHYQLAIEKTVADIRQLFEKGSALV